jgi:hypothetical protein
MPQAGSREIGAAKVAVREDNAVECRVDEFSAGEARARHGTARPRRSCEIRTCEVRALDGASVETRAGADRALKQPGVAEIRVRQRDRVQLDLGQVGLARVDDIVAIADRCGELRVSERILARLDAPIPKSALQVCVNQDESLDHLWFDGVRLVREPIRGCECEPCADRCEPSGLDI